MFFEFLKRQLHRRSLSPKMASQPTRTIRRGKACSAFLLLLLTLLILFSLPSISVAKCTKEDLRFYLDQGFTELQTLAICAEAQKGTKYPDSARELRGGRRLARKVQRDLAFLEKAIASVSLRVTRDWVQYTVPFCIKTGNSPEVTARQEICADILTRVYFKGIKMLGERKKFLVFGKVSIAVEGKVKRKILHDFSHLPSKIERKRVLALFHRNLNKEGTLIPIDAGYPISKVIKVLNSLSS